MKIRATTLGPFVLTSVHVPRAHLAAPDVQHKPAGFELHAGRYFAGPGPKPQRHWTIDLRLDLPTRIVELGVVYARSGPPRIPDVSTVPQDPADAELAAMYDPADLDAITHGRYCLICGCTDERACEGGCAWASPNLCTRCTRVAAA